MNSSFRSIQILVDLLKQNDIRDIVLSPGGSDIPLIHSMETDGFFTCYSVVDERSAAYFAMGVAQEKKRPVACVCTSGTAVCNYLPAITEAFYQSVPVLAITADKNPYFEGQLEIQKIDQTHIFDGVVKKSVNLPMVHNKEDAGRSRLQSVVFRADSLYLFLAIILHIGSVPPNLTENNFQMTIQTLYA